MHGISQSIVLHKMSMDRVCREQALIENLSAKQEACNLSKSFQIQTVDILVARCDAPVLR